MYCYFVTLSIITIHLSNRMLTFLTVSSHLPHEGKPLLSLPIPWLPFSPTHAMFQIQSKGDLWVIWVNIAYNAAQMLLFKEALPMYEQWKTGHCIIPLISPDPDRGLASQCPAYSACKLQAVWIRIANQPEEKNPISLIEVLCTEMGSWSFSLHGN